MIIQFRPTAEEKATICNFIKSELEGKDYYLINILYNAHTGAITLANEEQVLKKMFNDNIFYNSFRYFSFDGEVTTKDIENKVFSR